LDKKIKKNLDFGQGFWYVDNKPFLWRALRPKRLGRGELNSEAA
jgi:hypothetical protein